MKTNLNSANLQLKTDVPGLTPRAIALCLLAGVLLLMVLGLAGCKEGPSAPRPSLGSATNLTGDYALVSVNGKAVPCIVAHEDHDVTIKSGVFTFNADGTCQSRSVFCVAGGKDVDRVVEATYTGSGAELTMRWKRAGITKGSIDAGTFTMNNEGMIFCYRK